MAPKSLRYCAELRRNSAEIGPYSGKLLGYSAEVLRSSLHIGTIAHNVRAYGLKLRAIATNLCAIARVYIPMGHWVFL